MNRWLLYLVPISLIGFTAPAPPASAALRNDDGVTNPAATSMKGDNAPLMLAQRGGRAGGGAWGGGGYAGGARAGTAGGGFNRSAAAGSSSWSGVSASNRSVNTANVNRTNVNNVNVNRNVNVSGSGYYGGYDPYYAPYRPRAYRGGGSAHVEWCYARYRSYREYDNTYQPYHGRRRQCLSPYG